MQMAMALVSAIASLVALRSWKANSIFRKRKLWMCPKDLFSVSIFKFFLIFIVVKYLQYCDRNTRKTFCFANRFSGFVICIFVFYFLLALTLSVVPGKLKNGQSITLADGTIIQPDQVLGESELSKYFIGMLIFYVSCFLYVLYSPHVGGSRTMFETCCTFEIRHTYFLMYLFCCLFFLNVSYFFSMQLYAVFCHRKKSCLSRLHRMQS